MKLLFFLNIFLMTLPAMAAEPQVSAIPCDKGGIQAVTVSAVNIPLSRAPLMKNSLISCQQIKWNDLNLISVQYTTKEQVSYSGAYRTARYNEVFRVQDGKAEAQFADIVDRMKPVWMDEKGFLVMRNQDKDAHGKPLLLNGYIYLTPEAKFEDFATFAIDNGWQVN